MRDPIAPVRKRPRRIAKKLANRLGMMRCRGFSVNRFFRFSRALGTAMGEALNRAADRPYLAGEKPLPAGYSIATDADGVRRIVRHKQPLPPDCRSVFSAAAAQATATP